MKITHEYGNGGVQISEVTHFTAGAISVEVILEVVVSKLEMHIYPF